MMPTLLSLLQGSAVTAIKVEGVKRLGGEGIIAGNSSAERYERARALADERGLTMVSPFESLDVIAGQGTCGLEIVEDLPDVDADWWEGYVARLRGIASGMIVVMAFLGNVFSPMDGLLLDIDGVLAPIRQWDRYGDLDPACIQVLNEIAADRSGAEDRDRRTGRDVELTLDEGVGQLAEHEAE